jgi:large subunit ribosomal protein L4
VALGPKPRSYKQRTPKKMIRLALHSALSDRAADDKVVVVDSWDFAEPSTSAARTMLEALGIEGRVLVVLGEDDVNAQKSFRNLPEVHTLLGRELNAYDILVADWVLFSNATLPTAPPNKRDKAAAAAAEAEPTDAEPTDAEPTDDGADDATDGSEEE